MVLGSNVEFIPSVDIVKNNTYLIFSKSMVNYISNRKQGCHKIRCSLHDYLGLKNLYRIAISIENFKKIKLNPS